MYVYRSLWGNKVPIRIIRDSEVVDSQELQHVVHKGPDRTCTQVAVDEGEEIFHLVGRPCSHVDNRGRGWWGGKDAMSLRWWWLSWNRRNWHWLRTQGDGHDVFNGLAEHTCRYLDYENQEVKQYIIFKKISQNTRIILSFSQQIAQGGGWPRQFVRLQLSQTSGSLLLSLYAGGTVIRVLEWVTVLRDEVEKDKTICNPKLTLIYTT